MGTICYLNRYNTKEIVIALILYTHEIKNNYTNSIYLFHHIRHIKINISTLEMLFHHCTNIQSVNNICNSNIIQ